MSKKPYLSIVLVAAGALGGFWLLRWGLPIVLPFALGAALALAAEPLTRLLTRKTRLPRAGASAVAVTAVFVGLAAIVTLIAAVVVRQAGQLARVLPDMSRSVEQGLSGLQGQLLRLAEKAPESLRPALESTVSDLFSGSGAAMSRFTESLLGIATALVGWIAGSALAVATGILSAFMISARLPALRAAACRALPSGWTEPCCRALKELRGSLLGWLSAQLKLSAITLGQLLIGFWLLRIPHAWIWALAVTFVDAFPVLGIGTVLIPWSILCFLQDQAVRGAGLLGLYAVVWLVRSVLEPKLLGSELGLDPLVTLIAIYAGYKLLGLPGMILAPMVAVAAVRLLKGAKCAKK